MSNMSGTVSIAEINGGTIAYEVAGTGQAVLLIHGSNLDSRMWEWQFAELAKQYQVVRFDLRGMGQSPAATEAFTNYDDIRALLDHLQIDQAVVVGHSFGGYVAAEFALVYPERVKGLVISSYGFGAAPSEETLTLRTRFQEAMGRGDTEAGVALMLEAYVDGVGQLPDRVDSKVRVLYDEMTRYSFALPRGKMPTWLQPSPNERIAELHMPILTIVGSYDFSEYRAGADRLVAELPHARKVLFPQAAHSLCMEQPELWNQTVIEFIEQL